MTANAMPRPSKPVQLTAPRPATSGANLASLRPVLAAYAPPEADANKRQDAPIPSENQKLGCRDLFKSYRKGALGIPVLRGVDLDVSGGEFLAVVGQSGSGKSTLLHLLGTLDRPDAGHVIFENHRIDDLPSSARDLLRNKYLGMVFQFYHLLPELTTLQNVLAPAYIAESAFGYWRRRKAYRTRAAELLELVGLTHRSGHKPSELSGGEMQRAAIARALLSRPRVLLADEPTGNLDRGSGERIMETLVELKERENLTIVMVTHDPWVANKADRVVHLEEGKVVL